MVSSAIMAIVPEAPMGRMPVAWIRNPKAAAFVPVAISAVTGVGLPW